MINALDIGIFMAAIGLAVRALCVLNRMCWRTWISRPWMPAVYLLLALAAFGSVMDVLYFDNLGPELTHRFLLLVVAVVLLLERGAGPRAERKPPANPGTGADTMKLDPVRMAWLLFALLVALLIGVPVLSARLAHADVQIVCDGELCATTRASMEAIVRELQRLRGLIGKDCT